MIYKTISPVYLSEVNKVRDLLLKLELVKFLIYFGLSFVEDMMVTTMDTINQSI